MDQIRRMTTPSLYLQGKGVVYYLGQKALAYGNKAYVIGGETALSVAGDSVRKSLESNGIEVSLWDSTVKECTKGKIGELADKGREVHPHFVIGVGGGKAVDTAKAVAWKLKIPSMVVGTQCATNSDTSAESVIYTEDHKFMESIVLPRNPVIVIEDTDILCKAPHKYLVWGMGDALSCKYESDAFAKAREKKKDGPVPTGTALALADACFKSLMEHGLKAVRDVRNGLHSTDVDEVIEAVKLSSAMAFENTGCALAHALHNGLTRTGAMKSQHGEIVAYCTIIQAAYEGRRKEEVDGLISWCDSVGLPTKLFMLGEVNKAALKRAVDYACEKDHNAKNMPDKPKSSDVLRIIEELERGR